MNEKDNRNRSIFSCPECGERDFVLDTEKSEHFCASCGLVVFYVDYIDYNVKSKVIADPIKISYTTDTGWDDHLDKIMKFAKKAVRIDLSNRMISRISLSPLSVCDSFETLQLNDNQLKNIDLTGLSSCINLNVIDLENNQLREIDLSPLSSCKNLQKIKLAENRFKHIDLTFLPKNTEVEVGLFFECPECGGKKVVHDRNELVCASCKLVVSEHRIDPGPEYRAFMREKRDSESGKRSEISRLRKWQIRSDKGKQKGKDRGFTCPDCGGKDVVQDMEKGERICASCGLVVSEHRIDTGPEWRAFTSDEKDARSTMIDWRQKSRLTTTRSAQIYRLRKWRNQSEECVLHSWLPRKDSVYLRPETITNWSFLQRVASQYGTDFRIQQDILYALGLSDYGFIDADLRSLFLSIPPDTPIQQAREEITTAVVKEIVATIDRGGKTIGLNLRNEIGKFRNLIDILEKHEELKEREQQINNQRRDELQYFLQNIVPDNLSLNNGELSSLVEWGTYDSLTIEVLSKNLKQLWLTARGYSILSRYDLPLSVEIRQGKNNKLLVQSQVYENLQKVRDAFSNYGFDLKKKIPDYGSKISDELEQAIMWIAMNRGKRWVEISESKE